MSIRSQTFQNYIGGEWVSGSTTIPNINPSNLDDVIGEFPQASASDTELAIAAARAAFPAWSRTNPQRRYDLLTAIGNGIMARKDEIGRLLAREEGKTLPEGVGETMRAAQIFHFFAAECLRLAGEIIPSVRPGATVEITREPLGVIGIITPWNFPIAIPAWKIAPALAYGNCVVFKPAELVPATAHALSEIIVGAGLPPGVFNLVTGRGTVVGETMINHNHVAAITFTGSVATGRQIAAACASCLKKLQMEMGGKNPLVVLDDADLDNAMDCTIIGSYFSTGQRCTASSRLVVTEGIHDRFVEALTARMKTLVVDDALKPGTQIGPVIDERQLATDLSYLDIARNEGATLHWGGERLERATRGHYLQPVLFTGVTNDMRIAREEVFGPVATVIRVRNYEEALAVANDTEFGLSSGICTTSLKHAAHFKRNSEAGMVMVNMPTAGVDYHVPFGGRKGSSYGSREQGRYAAEFYTTVKTAYVNDFADTAPPATLASLRGRQA